MLTREQARKIALSIEGASEGLHFGKPAIFVREEFVTRIHHKEKAVVILTGSLDMRDMMLEAEPKLFYIIDHYKKRPALLARLSRLDKKTLLDLLKPRLLQLAARPPAKPKAKKAKAKKTKKPAGK